MEFLSFRALARLPWRYIGLALAVAGALWWVYHRGVSAERARLMPQLELARANVATLKAELAKQNAAIAAQGKAAERMDKASDKAVRSGAERRGAVEVQAARVEAVRPAVAVGAVPADVRALWGEV